MDPLAALSALFGWVYTLCWSLSFYPQPLLNARRRSTAGTTVDFPLVNCLGFLTYLLSNAALRYSPTIRAQYAARHHGHAPTVAANDVAFAAHALVLSLVTLSQYLLPHLWWKRGGSSGGSNSGESERLLAPVDESARRPSPSRPSRVIVGFMASCVAGVALVVVRVLMDGGGGGVGGVSDTVGDGAAAVANAPAIASSGWAWLDVVYALGYVKLAVTLVKYSPQVLANWRNRSTHGWSIVQILLDWTGGVLSIAQLLIDSRRQGDWSGVTGNPVKLALGNVSMAYDAVFIVQHYVLYGGVEAERDAVEEEREGERDVVR